MSKEQDLQATAAAIGALAGPPGHHRLQAQKASQARRVWCAECKPRQVGGDRQHAGDCSVMSTPEPRRRYAEVRDRDGDVWRRGNTRWTCTTPVDGVRVRNVGRLHWQDLLAMYGPLTTLGDDT